MAYSIIEIADINTASWVGYKEEMKCKLCLLEKEQEVKYALLLTAIHNQEFATKMK